MVDFCESKFAMSCHRCYSPMFDFFDLIFWVECLEAKHAHFLNLGESAEDLSISFSSK